MSKEMQLKTVVYRVFYQGKQYQMPLSVSTGVEQREKVPVHRKKRELPQ